MIDIQPYPSQHSQEQDIELDRIDIDANRAEPQPVESVPSPHVIQRGDSFALRHVLQLQRQDSVHANIARDLTLIQRTSFKIFIVTLLYFLLQVSDSPDTFN
jgi:hypothetical protein